MLLFEAVGGAALEQKTREAVEICPAVSRGLESPGGRSQTESIFL